MWHGNVEKEMTALVQPLIRYHVLSFLCVLFHPWQLCVHCTDERNKTCSNKFAVELFIITLHILALSVDVGNTRSFVVLHPSFFFVKWSPMSFDVENNVIWWRDSIRIDGFDTCSSQGKCKQCALLE